MNRRRWALVIPFVIVVLIAGAFWFVVRPGSGGPGPPADVVVNAPQLEATSEGQRLFRIDPTRTTARYQAFEELLGGDLTVKGIAAPTVWEVIFEFDDAHLRGSAKAQVLMSTYGVGPISIIGFLKTQDEVSLSIDLVAYDVAAGGGPDVSADEQSASAGVQGDDGLSFA